MTHTFSNSDLGDLISPNYICFLTSLIEMKREGHLPSPKIVNGLFEVVLLQVDYQNLFYNEDGWKLVTEILFKMWSFYHPGTFPPAYFLLNLSDKMLDEIPDIYDGELQ